MSCVCARALRSMVSQALLQSRRGRCAPRPQELRPAEDRVQRRAQLVRERGEELVLHPVRPLGLRAGELLALQELAALFRGLPGRLLRPPVLGDIAEGPHPPRGAAVDHLDLREALEHPPVPEVQHPVALRGRGGVDVGDSLEIGLAVRDLSRQVVVDAIHRGDDVAGQPPHLDESRVEAW